MNLLIKKMMNEKIKYMLIFTLSTVAMLSSVSGLSAQEIDKSITEENQVESAPVEVMVTNMPADELISSRIQRILNATDWFDEEDVKVDEGVVFLKGFTHDERHKQWAGRLARNTEGVVAVVNQIQILDQSNWDFTPAYKEIRLMMKRFVEALPQILLALLILVTTFFLTGMMSRLINRTLSKTIPNGILRQMTAKLIAVIVFIFGLYMALKVSGLTRLALTLISGTGLMGLVIGFAFRDIAENFLASILISMHHPFEKGDFIRVAGLEGFVQSVNTRSTILMTPEGNHAQIPNAVIYKETIINVSSNPNLRADFIVGIGYDDPISEAQNIGLKVLENHPAVIKDPESLVLVEELGASTVNLRFYFWIDARHYSVYKVKSAIIRLVKKAFVEHQISMPDESREIVFPKGVPVHMLSEEDIDNKEKATKKFMKDSNNSHAVKAEGDLESESVDIQKQADKARNPEEGVNLLDESNTDLKTP